MIEAPLHQFAEIEYTTTAITSHIDEDSSELITAIDMGTDKGELVLLTTVVYDDTGGVAEETRVYFDIPASGSGSDGTNYDPTTYAYNDQGSSIRTVAPHGTISRVNYDTLGRVSSQWTGTNDYAFVSGESTGPDDMVKTLENTYDSGSAGGNSLLTKRTLFVEDSTTDKRETSFSYDVRGRNLLQTNPEAPHVFSKFDNMSRPVASGLFSSTASITVGSDDPTTETTNRIGLSQTFYDEMGRVWKDSDDQVTLYFFGVSKGATSSGYSKIGAGHLLHATVYPDSDNAGTTSTDFDTDDSDVVTFAYNAQEQTVYQKDQDGTIIDFEYDDAGRGTDSKATLASGVDSAVKRIETAYDSLGRVNTVTQHSTTGESVVDEVKYTYDNWGPVSKLEQDHNTTIGGTLLYDVDYVYEKAVDGRNTIRRTSMDLPDGTTVTIDYLGSSDQHDDEASRVTQLRVGGNAPEVAYDYNGIAEVVGITYDAPDVQWEMYGSTSGSYPDLDRFNRVTTSRWTKNLNFDRDFYDVDVTYDRNSNVTFVDDNIHLGFDMDLEMDDRDRLIDADEGEWTGSSWSPLSRTQAWQVDTGSGWVAGVAQTGNWDRVQLNLNAGVDSDFVDTGEYDDTRTHNLVNELAAQDVDSDSTDDYTLTYDGAGRLTDHAQNYEYVYDAFNRLRKINDTSDQSLVAEFTYNGLGYRIGWHYDVDADGDVDGNDPWYRFVCVLPVSVCSLD